MYGTLLIASSYNMSELNVRRKSQRMQLDEEQQILTSENLSNLFGFLAKHHVKTGLPLADRWTGCQISQLVLVFLSRKASFSTSIDGEIPHLNQVQPSVVAARWQEPAAQTLPSGSVPVCCETGVMERLTRYRINQSVPKKKSGGVPLLQLERPAFY